MSVFSFWLYISISMSWCVFVFCVIIFWYIRQFRQFWQSKNGFDYIFLQYFCCYHRFIADNFNFFWDFLWLQLSMIFGTINHFFFRYFMRFRLIYWTKVTNKLRMKMFDYVLKMNCKQNLPHPASKHPWLCLMVFSFFVYLITRK